MKQMRIRKMLIASQTENVLVGGCLGRRLSWSEAQGLPLIRDLLEVLDALLAGDGLLGALACPRIRASPLPPNRKATTMTQATVASDVFQAGNILGNLPAQLPLDHVILIEEGGHAGQFVFVEITCIGERINPSLMAQFASHTRPHAIKILKRIDGLLFRRDVDAEQTRHVRNPEL